jgi:diguanylate cyclase (GGDEF)-like protein
LSKPDFRAAVAGRLHAERQKVLSRSVLRLLSVDDEVVATPDGADEPAADSIELAADPSSLDDPAGARSGESRRGTGRDRVWPGSLDEMDPVSGLFAEGAWARILHNEADRYARHGRRVTVVIAEIEGLDAPAPGLGDDAVRQVTAWVAESARRNARGSDVLARTGRARYAALLPETDEIAAINFVERVRDECDGWLSARGPALRLAIGWAHPPAGSGLAEALRLADDRMNADRRRGSRSLSSSGRA